MPNLSRKEKEQLYIRKMTELQRRWKNRIDNSDFDDLPEWTDEQLDKGLKDTVGQLRYQKTTSWIGKGIIAAFIIWGIVGFLSQDQESQNKTVINGAIFLAAYFALTWLYELKKASHETNRLLRELISSANQIEKNIDERRH
jgi:hypothetical protein